MAPGPKHPVGAPKSDEVRSKASENAALSPNLLQKSPMKVQKRLFRAKLDGESEFVVEIGEVPRIVELKSKNH